MQEALKVLPLGFPIVPCKEVLTSFFLKGSESKCKRFGVVRTMFFLLGIKQVQIYLGAIRRVPQAQINEEKGGGASNFN